MKTQLNQKRLHSPLPLRSFTGEMIKKIARKYEKGAFLALSLSLLPCPAFAQGWVNFANSSATLFSVGNPGDAQVASQGTYYFALLTAPPGASIPNQFAFSGRYATNLAVAGRFFGGTFVEVPNWAVGTNESFLVAGWSAKLGLDWNQAWLDGVFSTSGYFGLSSIGTGVAGGLISTNRPPLPPLNLFAGATGLQSGFSLYPVPVPEPSPVVIAAVGVATLALYPRGRAKNFSRHGYWRGLSNAGAARLQCRQAAPILTGPPVPRTLHLGFHSDQYRR